MKGNLVTLFLLALMPAAAQDLPRLPDETMTLIGEGRALAPEFSSDVLLRLAGSHIVADPAWKHQLIEEAFTAGGRAQLPYPKAGEETTDARASRAYWKNGLDALSLQTRSVEKMLELDAQRARLLFEEISTPEVPALNCQETGAPDLSAYYETARHVVEKAFTAEQKTRLEHVGFLKGLIERMQSPAHVTPVVKLIFTVGVTPEERQELVETFVAVLPRIRDSARVFGAAAFRLVPVSAPVQLPPGINPAPPLLDAGPGQLPPQLVAVPQLMPALRSYIVRYVSHNLWFTQLKNQWQSKDAAIVQGFVNSANPVMSIYARVNKRISE